MKIMNIICILSSTITVLSCSTINSKKIIRKYNKILPSSLRSPNNNFPSNWKDQLMKEEYPAFIKYLNQIEISPSLFNAQNIKVTTVLPLIKSKFRDSSWKTVEHSTKRVLRFLLTKNKNIKITESDVDSKHEYEFNYQDVTRKNLSVPVKLSLITGDGLIEVQAKQLNSVIRNDGSCSWTRHHLVFKKKSHAYNNQTLGIAYISEDYTPTKVRMEIEENIELNKQKITFYKYDLNNDGVWDYIWGKDSERNYNAEYNKFYSAYNLHGDWVVETVRDSSYWDHGC